MVNRTLREEKWLREGVDNQTLGGGQEDTELRWIIGAASGGSTTISSTAEGGGEELRPSVFFGGAITDWKTNKIFFVGLPLVPPPLSRCAPLPVKPLGSPPPLLPCPAPPQSR